MNASSSDGVTSRLLASRAPRQGEYVALDPGCPKLTLRELSVDCRGGLTLIEYIVLTLFLGIAGVAAMSAISEQIVDVADGQAETLPERAGAGLFR